MTHRPLGDGGCERRARSNPVADVSYDAVRCRLRVVGSCQDVSGIEEALAEFGVRAGRLTIDLIATDDVSPEVARVLVAARRTAIEQGRQLVLLRRSGTAADRALDEAGRSGT